MGMGYIEITQKIGTRLRKALDAKCEVRVSFLNGGASNRCFRKIHHLSHGLCLGSVIFATCFVIGLLIFRQPFL